MDEEELAKEIRKHNQKVKEEFHLAEQGEIINLTDLMIVHETLLMAQEWLRQARLTTETYQEK